MVVERSVCRLMAHEGLDSNVAQAEFFGQHLPSVRRDHDVRMRVGVDEQLHQASCVGRAAGAGDGHHDVFHERVILRKRLGWIVFG